MGAKRILIVEDEPILPILLKKVLIRHGYDVCGVVSRGRDAVEQALALVPDLILMDIYLEDDLDGIQAATLINQERHIPVIYTTGAIKEVIADRLADSHCAAVLYKPYDMDKLTSRIDSILAASA